MDVLSCLGFDRLPEEQTRTSHPLVRSALSANPELRLGFDSCLNCAACLVPTSPSSPDEDNEDNEDNVEEEEDDDEEEKGESDDYAKKKVMAKKPTNTAASKKRIKNKRETTKKNKASSSPSSPSSLERSIKCKGCGRVRYCSKRCRDEDASGGARRRFGGVSNGTEYDGNDGEDGKDDEDAGAMGHGPVVCALLRLCDADEDVDHKYQRRHGHDNKSASCSKSQEAAAAALEAARDRVRSEYESYPATLGRILCEGPVYRRFRSTPSERPYDSLTSLQYKPSRTCLTVHVVGASEEAELWGYCKRRRRGSAVARSKSRRSGNANDDDHDDPYHAYAEAMSDLAADGGWDVVRIVFVGPDCPCVDSKIVCVMQDAWGADGGYGGDDDNDNYNDNNDNNNDDYNAGNRNRTKRQGQRPKQRQKQRRTLVVETIRGEYDNVTLSRASTNDSVDKKKTGLTDTSEARATTYTNANKVDVPDVVVFFNPGFTCPDYDWTRALRAVRHGTPYLVATNTEMEALADCRYLMEHGYVDSLSPDVEDIVLSSHVADEDDDYDDNDDDDDDDHHHDDNDEEEKETEEQAFFGENPYAGSRIRQSGTMGNDLFVKNRWIFGGIWGGRRGTNEKKRRRKRGRQQQLTRPGIAGDELDRNYQSNGTNTKTKTKTTRIKLKKNDKGLNNGYCDGDDNDNDNNDNNNDTECNHDGRDKRSKKRKQNNNMKTKEKEKQCKRGTKMNKTVETAAAKVSLVKRMNPALM